MKPETLLMDLPPFKGQRVTVTEKQSVGRIMKEILQAHTDYSGHYDKICKYFIGRNVNSVERQLFDFCKENLDYRVESEKTQTVRSPAAILVLNDIRGVDCKHYASFIGGVLDAINRAGYAKFDWCYRFASYDIMDDIPEHVFVVVKYGSREVWIDPVLDYFNTRFPYPIYWQDEKPSSMSLAKISGLERISGLQKLGYPYGFESTNFQSGQISFDCGCGVIGATTSQVGGYIQAVAPALAVVPVVGWVGAAGAELVGFFLKTFGSKYQTSTGVRWLIQLYEYYVLGLPTRSDNQVNEANEANAQKWFTYVLGVPIYDRLRFDALKKSGTAYINLSNAPDTKNIDPALAAKASAIAQMLNYAAPPGGWRNQTIAPWLVVDPAGQVSQTKSGVLSVNSSGQLVSTGTGIVGWIKQHPLATVAIAAGLAFVVFSSGK